MDPTGQNSILFSLMPILTSLTFMARDPNFNILHSLPYIVTLCIPILMHFPDTNTMLKYAKSIFIRKKTTTMNFTASINLKSWSEEPNSIVRCFSTVLWYWNSINETVNCKTLMEEPALRPYYYDEERNTTTTQPIFVNDRGVVFWRKGVTNIQYRMWMDRNTDREGHENREIFLQIDFLDIAEPNRIVEHINYIKAESKRILREQNQKQRVLVSTLPAESDSEKPPGPSFMIYEFASTSTFANFFCEEASTVKKDLDYFLQCKQEYERLGKPWTYTILNEGPPGVGKTKLVKAIAKETGYTLIVINLAHIPSTQVLYEAFHTSVLGGESVPHDKRLYYIPEVDTQMFDLLKRSPDEPTSIVLPDPAKKKTTVEHKPTLGEILNVLDGVPERHGHILVLDTNHLQQLDPALIRPGRVDRILSWKKMSKQSVREYLEHCYQTNLPKKLSLPDRKYSAAELQSIVKQYEDCEDCVRGLRKGGC